MTRTYSTAPHDYAVSIDSKGLYSTARILHAPTTDIYLNGLGPGLEVLGVVGSSTRIAWYHHYVCCSSCRKGHPQTSPGVESGFRQLWTQARAAQGTTEHILCSVPDIYVSALRLLTHTT